MSMLSCVDEGVIDEGNGIFTSTSLTVRAAGTIIESRDDSVVLVWQGTGINVVG